MMNDAVNPEQIARQVEGSFVYGLSSLLYGECTVRDGLCVPKTSSVLIWRRNHITIRGDGGLLSLQFVDLAAQVNKPA